jgi:transcription antitermination factor NusG
VSGVVDRWVVLELSHQGEKRTPREITEILRHHLGSDTEVFIPAATFTRGQTQVTIYALEGYVFVQAGLPSANYYDLEENLHFRRVLSKEEPLGRFLYYVGPETVDELRAKLQAQTARNVTEGTKVQITEGTYSGLIGKVLDTFEDESATVHVTDLKSMEVIVRLPYQFLELHVYDILGDSDDTDI